MAGSSKMTHDDGGTPAGWTLIRFALRPSPADFTLVGFAARLGHHLVIYGGLSIAAIWACIFVFAPVETSLISLGCLLVADIAIRFSSSSSRREARVFYAFGAGDALKDIVAIARLKASEAKKALGELLRRMV